MSQQLCYGAHAQRDVGYAGGRPNDAVRSARSRSSRAILQGHASTGRILILTPLHGEMSLQAVDQDCCSKRMKPSASGNRNGASASDSKSAWWHEDVAVSQPKALTM